MGVLTEKGYMTFEELEKLRKPEFEEVNGGRHSRLGLRFDFIDPIVLERLAKILHDGAESHNDPDGSNWRKIPVNHHINHAIYHINEFQKGTQGEDQLGHAFCRLMFAMVLEGQE